MKADQAETLRKKNTLDHEKEEKQKNILDYKKSGEHFGQGIKEQ